MVALTLIGGEGSDLDLVAVLCWELGCVGIEELDDSIRATFADRAAAVAASTRLAEFVIGAPLTIDDPLAGWSPPPVETDTEAFRIRPPGAGDPHPTIAGDRLAIVIDPARAFGTGGHPTTCAALDLLALAPTGRRVLDVGTGTGILAIAAVRLGATEVTAIDVDPSAVEAARANVARNDVADRVRVAEAPIDSVPGEFDLVLVNLTIDVHELVGPAIVTRLGPDGRVIATGILAGDQERRLEECFEGLSVIGRRQDREWAALVLARR